MSVNKKAIFNKPILGFQLSTLTRTLHVSTRSEVAYVLGIPTVTWYRLTSRRQGGETIIPRVTMGIMARFALSFPERIQRPKYPTPAEVYQALIKAAPDESYNHLSFYLGREISAGNRWVQGNKSFDATTQRLALHLHQYLRDGRLKRWRHLVMSEERVRIAAGKSKKSFTLTNPQALDPAYVKTTEVSERLVVGDDLAELANLLQLETKDIYFHLGVSTQAWYEALKHPFHPIKDASLCILYRLYKAIPEELDEVRLPRGDINALFEALNDPAYSDKHYNPEDVALLLGVSPLIVKRWLSGVQGGTVQTTMTHTPVQDRLISHLHQEVKAGRLESWIRMLHIEAQTRGIDNFWLEGWPSTITNRNE